MHRTIAFSLTVLLLLVGTPAGAGTIYTWTDADGVKRFSNAQPPDDVETVETRSEVAADPEADERIRQEYDRMVEESTRGAERYIQEKRDQQELAVEAERLAEQQAQDARIDAERARLQQAIDEIDARGLGPTFTTGMKVNLIRQIQEQMERLESDPEGYFGQ